MRRLVAESEEDERGGLRSLVGCSGVHEGENEG